MEKKETPQRNLRRFFVVGREPEKVTFRFAERYASFNFSGTFRFADYITVHAASTENIIIIGRRKDNLVPEFFMIFLLNLYGMVQR